MIGIRQAEITVGESALKHGLSEDYIRKMWRSESCEGFEVHRLPPRETNLIVIRFVDSPEGTLEMIAEERPHDYFVFHALLIEEQQGSALIEEARRLFEGQQGNVRRES